MVMMTRTVICVKKLNIFLSDKFCKSIGSKCRRTHNLFDNSRLVLFYNL